MSARPPRLFEPNGRWPSERADERRAAGSSRLESSAERRRQARFAFRSEPLRRQAFRTWNQRDLLRKRPRAVFLPNGFARRLFSTRSCHLDHGLRRPARPAGIDRCLPKLLSNGNRRWPRTAMRTVVNDGLDLLLCNRSRAAGRTKRFRESKIIFRSGARRSKIRGAALRAAPPCLRARRPNAERSCRGARRREPCPMLHAAERAGADYECVCRERAASPFANAF